jgi:hypothetical protein
MCHGRRRKASSEAPRQDEGSRIQAGDNLGPGCECPGFKEQIARAIEAINADADSQRVMEEMLALSDFSDWK